MVVMAMKANPKQQQKKKAETKEEFKVEGTPAEIVDLLGRAGMKGVMTVRCRLLSGRDAGKVLVRNVMGPIRLNDILVLKETEMESVGRMSKR